MSDPIVFVQYYYNLASVDHNFFLCIIILLFNNIKKEKVVVE
jgi:hypothetical protein